MSTYHQLLPEAATMKNLAKREPAVLIGLCVALVTAVATAASQSIVGGKIDWSLTAIAAIPLVCGVLVRFGVFSPATVEQIKADAAAAAKAASVINVTVHAASTVDQTATAVARAIADHG